MTAKEIKISLLESNNGQVEGLPKNPRSISAEDFDKLVKSIKDDPEMMQLRECIVFPHGGKFVVLGGNQRLEACRVLGYSVIPCKVLPKTTPIEKLKAIAIKDNGHFGEWDTEILADFWADMPFEDWGIPFSMPEGIGDVPETAIIEPYRKAHVLISFPPERMMEIQDFIASIRNYPDVEIEQSAN
jgi:hypothetical protein